MINFIVNNLKSPNQIEDLRHFVKASLLFNIKKKKFIRYKNIRFHLIEIKLLDSTN
jgi:hypothetical protein